MFGSRGRLLGLVGLSVIAVACQTVVESGDDERLAPLASAPVTASPAATSATTVAPTIASTAATAPSAASTTTVATSTAPPTTTTTLPPPTTLPATTTAVPTTSTTTTTTSTSTTTSTTVVSTSTTTRTTTTTATATSSTEPPYRPEPATASLSEGDQGERTRAMQGQLIVLGYLPAGSDDGLFGPVTTRAVREFQADNGLQVDGFVGPSTRAALAAAVAAA